MIKHEVRSISNSTATSLDLPENIRSSYTLVVQNVNNSGYIYIGNEEVTTSNYGYKLFPGQGITIELPSRTTMYAISSNGGMSLAIMEISRAI